MVTEKLFLDLEGLIWKNLYFCEKATLKSDLFMVWLGNFGSIPVGLVFYFA
jgi:hypothetical protein